MGIKLFPDGGEITDLEDLEEIKRNYNNNKSNKWIKRELGCEISNKKEYTFC